MPTVFRAKEPGTCARTGRQFKTGCFVVQTERGVEIADVDQNVVADMVASHQGYRRQMTRLWRRGTLRNSG